MEKSELEEDLFIEGNCCLDVGLPVSGLLNPSEPRPARCGSHENLGEMLYQSIFISSQFSSYQIVEARSIACSCFVTVAYSIHML